MAAENVANAQQGIEKNGYEPLTLEAEEIPVLLTDVAAESSNSAYAPGLFGFNDTGYETFKAIVLNFSQSEHDPTTETENNMKNEHVDTPAMMSNKQFYMGNHGERNNVSFTEKPKKSNKRNKKSVGTRYSKIKMRPPKIYSSN